MSPSVRTGIGYDSHRFAEGRPLILGGVEIEGAERGLTGHSDADVLTHAVIDALLGAAALGDIGHHFPDSDERWRDADSIALLAEVCRLVRAEGCRVANVDSTVVCEAPKLGPWRDAMRARLAEAAGLEPGAVSVKFTTNEGMGFIGRGEGIAAVAVATPRARDGAGACIRRRRPAGRADPERRGLLEGARRALPGADRAARSRAERLPHACCASARSPTPSRRTPAGRPARTARSGRCSASRSRSRTSRTWPARSRRWGTAANVTPARQDSELVRRLRAAGAVILGKTNLPELAIMGDTEGPSFGITRNPWNTDRSPAGSSGGSAAAVAAGLCAAATASDGAGSIRLPAANCGLVGLKPTRDLIPLSGAGRALVRAERGRAS